MKRLPVEQNVKPPVPIRTLIEPGIYGPEFSFRPNTKVARFVVNFAFNAGGLGDYINYSGATTWIAKNCPWIEGKVLVNEYLVPLMREIHKGFPGWEVFPGERAGQYIEPGSPLVGPEIHLQGQNVNPQLLNAVGCHLFDLGFAYYANRCPAPKDALLPMLDFPEHKLLPKIKRLHKKYVVVCVGSMVPSRWVSGEQLNPVIRHIKELGLTPVFLGKKDICSNGSLIAHFSDDIAFDEGLDMREQTSIIDAACILQHAIATVGLDSGLLHLASIMKDSNVVFAYNIVKPEDRYPRRTWGRTIDIFLTEQELSCAGCQSRRAVFLNQTFHKCFHADEDRKEKEALGLEYTSPKCVDLLFGNGGEKFKKALKEIMDHAV